MLSLLALASASAALVLPVLSENEQVKPLEAILDVEAKIQERYYTAVHQQVLEHINAKMPVSDRFSRVLRPMPMQYYASEIVSGGEDGMVDFRIVHFDRTIQDKQNGRTLVTTGQFNSKTGEVLLMDAITGKFVPAAQHSLILKRQNT